MRYNQDFIVDLGKNKDHEIDFLTHWKAYEKISDQVRTQRQVITPVETNSLLKSLDFETPSKEVF